MGFHLCEGIQLLFGNEEIAGKSMSYGLSSGNEKGARFENLTRCEGGSMLYMILVVLGNMRALLKS